MILKKLEHNGIIFFARKGTSDEKTFEEVIVRNVYEKRYFKIQENEHWIDLGGNVGAFALLALSKGATVEIYEPDPFNCKMIEKNLKANNFEAEIHQKAVVSNDLKKMKMFVGNNNQVWRNSLYKDWGNQSFNVECIHFSEVFTDSQHCCKMDIEGAEMTILESMDIFPKKMVFEWSFDIDESLNRYRNLVKMLNNNYKTVKAPSYSSDFVTWQKSWFPACANFFCYEEN
jgi:FkbM family methyltransferase